jgi:tricorn protease-like protein
MASYGGAPQRISHDLRFEYIIQPKWSPDGEWIAFTAELPSSARNIYRIRPDGRDFEQLTLTTDFIHSIQWSSDSEWLLVDQHYEGKRNILRLRVKDSTVENLTSGISFDYAPQYAPVAGLDWRPILLIFCALGMFIVSLVWRFRI